MYLFKINTTDISNNVVKDTYAVSREPVYKNYEDANGVVHRRFIRNKMKGKFQLFFPNLTDYAAFKTLLDNNRSTTNFSVNCSLYDNISGEHYTIDAYIDYSPTLKRTASLTEYLDKIDVTIEER